MFSISRTYKFGYLLDLRAFCRLIPNGICVQVWRLIPSSIGVQVCIGPIKLCILRGN